MSVIYFAPLIVDKICDCIRSDQCHIYDSNKTIDTIRDIFGAKCIQNTSSLYPAKFTESDISSGKCLWFGC